MNKLEKEGLNSISEKQLTAQCRVSVKGQRIMGGIEIKNEMTDVWAYVEQSWFSKHSSFWDMLYYYSKILNIWKPIYVGHCTTQ